MNLPSASAPSSVPPFVSPEPLSHEEIKRALLASYAESGGINHIDGTNLPSQQSVDRMAEDFMHLLFPGFFDEGGIHRQHVAGFVDGLLTRLNDRLITELEKSLQFGKHENPGKRAREVARILLSSFPSLRQIIQTDVMAAYQGDPAARSVDEVILAYPCVLVISLQRIANVLYRQGVPLLPRMLTEHAHERTGADIHPGARIGTHFFIDHCTGVVIGETARIGNHVKLYQGVTLGAKSFEVDNDGNPIKGVKRHPDIEDGVTIYAHATILGGDTVIGANTIIGANVWLLESTPQNSIAYYKGEGLVVRSRRKKEAAVENRPPHEMLSWDWVI